MKKTIFILLIMHTFSSYVQAEWFYRGTSNQWKATQLSLSNAEKYETCQKFLNGDSTGTSRFKIDRHGDWSESFPTNDFSVEPNQSYKISIDIISHNINVTLISNCNQVSEFNSNFSSLNFRGTANNWNNNEMQLVANNTWRTLISFDGQNNQRFKFDIYGNWSQNYGDSNLDDELELNGEDIFTGLVGNYIVEVNDQTLAYSISSSTGENIPPIAEISPEGQQIISVGVPIHFSAANSSDADGSVISYLWSTGETTENIELVFESIGQKHISLTVTDNDGASANDSVSILVQDNQVTDSWFFRGTSNNWSATEMVSTDNVNFCIQQAFFNGDGTNDNTNNSPRFKIDHFSNWIESFPEQDYFVDNNSTYEICFNNSNFQITVNKIQGADTQAPLVSASPVAGTYNHSQSINLSVTDNQDQAPKVYYTTDSSTPTTSSTLYDGGLIAASDIGNNIDLIIKTLSIDASDNRSVQSFSYIIDEQISVSSDFREETIYFLMTSRFYDGDSSNNYYNRDRIKAGDPHWRGDFKGVIEQLDYIKDLGFTAIWVTPPVENRSGLDYHGYHAYDWTKVDPRLESNGATYQDFINAAHANGLKVIQDVVINHSSQYGIRDQVWIDHLPLKYYVAQGMTQGEISNAPYFGNLGDYNSVNRDDNDNPVAPQWFIDRHLSDPDGTVPLVDPKTGETVPKAGYNPNRFFGIDAQGLDSNWYHLDGFMAGGDWENPLSLQRKHMAGDTIDLATENQNVKDYINNSIKIYLDMGVDAIRLDTAKHIERDELLSYTQNWQEHKPGLFVFGEVLVKGLGFGSEIANDNGPAEIRPWWYTRTGHQANNPQGDSKLSVLDFPLFSTFRDNVTRGSLGGIKGALDMDWTYADPTQLVTFFQNHDVGPDNDFKFRFCCEQSNAALAYNLLWTIRGIPSLYYGEEIMFKAGAPQDIESANDTIEETGRAYFGPHLDDKAITQNHPLYQHIKRLNQIRHAIPALQKGQMSLINEWGAGMSFVREFESSYVVVGLATGANQTISVTGIKNGIYRDAVSGNQVTVSNSSISFTVNSFSAGVYVLNGSGKIGVDGQYLR